MHRNLIPKIREARLHLTPIAANRRRDLIAQIFRQLADLRNADLAGHGIRTNRHLSRLIRSEAHTLRYLKNLSDGEFARMLEEFELLLVALTGVINTNDEAGLIN